MNMLKITAVTAALALSAAFAGCDKGPDSTVLARVNRTKITAGEFKRQLEDLQPQMQQAVASDPKARKEFLDDLIGIEVVLQEAKRQGLDKDPEFKKHEEKRRKEAELSLRDAARNELFNTLLKKVLADKLKAIPEPTDKEMHEYYAKNIERMRTPDGRKLAYKDVALQINRRMMAERQRDIYLDYAKGLKEKATISIDDKALDAAAASLVPSSALPGGLELQTSPAGTPEGKKK